MARNRYDTSSGRVLKRSSQASPPTRRNSGSETGSAGASRAVRPSVAKMPATSATWKSTRPCAPKAL